MYQTNVLICKATLGLGLSEEMLNSAIYRRAICQPAAQLLSYHYSTAVPIHAGIFAFMFPQGNASVININSLFPSATQDTVVLMLRNLSWKSSQVLSSP